MSNNNKLNQEAQKDIEDLFQEYVVNKIKFDDNVQQINDIISSYYDELSNKIKPINMLASIDDSLRTIGEFVSDNEDVPSQLTDDIKDLLDTNNDNKNELALLIKNLLDTNNGNKNELALLIKNLLDTDNGNKNELALLIKESFENQIKESNNNKNAITTFITQSLDTERKERVENKADICNTINEKFEEIEKIIKKNNKKSKIIITIFIVLSSIIQIGTLVLLLPK